MSTFVELMAVGGGTVFLSAADVVGIRTTGSADGLAEPKEPLMVLMRGSPREVAVFGLSASDLLGKLYDARASYLNARDKGDPLILKVFFLDGHE